MSDLIQKVNELSHKTGKNRNMILMELEHYARQYASEYAECMTLTASLNTPVPDRCAACVGYKALDMVFKYYSKDKEATR